MTLEEVYKFLIIGLVVLVLVLILINHEKLK